MTREERIEAMTDRCRTIPDIVAEYVVMRDEELVKLKVKLGVKDAVIIVLREKMDLMQARIRGILEDM